MNERVLWKAVIMQSVDDLFHGSDQERRAAFKWLFVNNKDFRTVCDYAAIDAMCLRQKVFEKIINGE